MQAAISNVLIGKLTPKEKPYDVRDNKLTGFLIRVNVSGKMLYMCEYDRAKRITIGKVGILTPAQARDKAQEILGDYTKGLDPKNLKKSQKALSFSQFVQNEYSPWFKANHKSHKSLDNLKHFTNAFGDKKLTEFNSFIIDKWRTKRLEQNRTPATVNRNLATLKAAFAKAHEWGFVDNHPLKQLKLTRVDAISKVQYLTKEEENKLRTILDLREEKLRAARTNANKWRRQRNQPEFPDLTNLPFADYLKPMVLISINTGLRRGELLSLTWENINLANAILTVASESAKSGKARHVPLNKEALETFKLWDQQCKIKSGLVFPGKSGKQLTDIKKSWMTVLKKAQIENFRWHDMRHHFASRLVMASVDLNTVRELLGHSDIKMTLRYAHLAPEHKADAVAKLDT